MNIVRLSFLFPGSIGVLLLCSCGHTESGKWTGRRWYVKTPETECRFWGYVKRPEDRWERARLVIMDERNGVRLPDRAEVAPGPPFTGDDHNFEYELSGRFTGQTAYDPNSDLELPLFSAESFHLLRRNPEALPGVGSNCFVPVREARQQLANRLR